ncbi:MAG: ABC transporter ATP-binding protein [Vampirovibrionales bacterium]
MPYLSLSHIDKQFGETAVLKDISLDVEAGDFVVLVGSSGCGKSTLLRCIAGLETPTRGEIVLEEESILNKAPQDRDVAMVFQNYALYPHMNVFDNMAFGLKMRKVPKALIQEKVQHAATLLGLESLLLRKPSQLSGGQCQRVALGRAIVRNPKLFLMDEPLSNLDAQLRQQMRQELKALHQKLGATTIYVTHDHTETLTLADKIVVMNKGKVAQYASPVVMYQEPANVFVARFMAQMNILVLHKKDEVFQLKSLEGSVFTEDLWMPDALKASLMPFFKSSETAQVLVGIRPEHVQVQNTVERHEETVDFMAYLQHRELHGAYQTLRLSPNQESSTALVAHAPFEAFASCLANTALSVGFTWDKAQFFDVESEERLLL